MDSEWIQSGIDALLPQLMPVGLKILTALAVLVIGRWVARMLSRVVKRVLLKANQDEMLANFLTNVTYVALLIAVFLAALDAIGFNTTSLLAIFGAAGLAIGLALQGSLSNFSSGVMLIVFRPFQAGNFVEVAGVSGTVEIVRMFNTIIRTPDNREIIVPNSQVFGQTITNYSARDTRRVDLVIGISYDDDVAKAKGLIGTVLEADERILKDPAPALFMVELADSSVNFAVRPWVETPNYWAVYGDLLERIKKTLEDNGVSIPYPQRDVHMREQKSG